MKCIAWYAKNPTFGFGAPANLANLTDTHVRLKDLDIETVPSADQLVYLERFYMQMQGEVWSPNGEARELIQSLGLKHTSISAGDVIEALDSESGPRFYEVMNIGFREL